MKLKYILASFVAAAALLVGCSVEEPVSKLDGLEVSNDYITVEAAAQSSASITVTSDEAWTATGADWLTLTPAAGMAGQSVTMTISASESDGPRKTEVKIQTASKTKIIIVNQKAPEGVEVPPSTVKEIMEGPDQTYKVTGTVTLITTTTYGNWYLNDGTSDVDLYIYGTLNKKGATYDKNGAPDMHNINCPSNPNAWDLSVGDVVTIEGPKSVYQGTVELVDVTIVNITKSLIDANLGTAEVGPEARKDTLFVSSKVQPVLVTVNADWVRIKDLTEDGNYLLEIDENTRTATRKATFTIKAPGAIKAVELVQNGAPSTGASVTEIIAAEDGDQVQTLPSTVVAALTTKGALLSDGTSYLYAYGDKAAALKIGDGVKMSATKTTYNGVPEITLAATDEVFVDSEGNAIEYPVATDITPAFSEYSSPVAEYIKFNGTLTVSGNYYNLEVDGVDPAVLQGSINYPIDALNAKSFDGKKITVTGFYNGMNTNKSTGVKYVNIIATKIEEYADNPKGSLANPYTPSEICGILRGGETISEDVYVKGIVCQTTKYNFGPSYNTASFWISDDGTYNDDKSKEFEAYSIYWLGSDIDNPVQGADIKGNFALGDEVVLYGKVTTYGETAETAGKKAVIYSINGATTDANGLGNAEYPFNITGAITFIDACTAATEAAKAEGQPAPTFPDVYVKGKVSKVQSPYSESYGTSIFWISDDGEFKNDPLKDFEAYSLYYFGGKSWVEGDKQIAVGDEVVLKGQLTYYPKNKVYETVSKKACLYSLNGATE